MLCVCVCVMRPPRLGCFLFYHTRSRNHHNKRDVSRFRVRVCAISNLRCPLWIGQRRPTSAGWPVQRRRGPRQRRVFCSAFLFRKGAGGLLQAPRGDYGRPHFPRQLSCIELHSVVLSPIQSHSVYCPLPFVNALLMSHSRISTHHASLNLPSSYDSLIPLLISHFLDDLNDSQPATLYLYLLRLSSTPRTIPDHHHLRLRPSCHFHPLSNL